MTTESQPPAITLTTRIRLNTKVRVQLDKITGKLTLLFPEGVLLLNPTGAAIVELCDGQHSVGEMIAKLAVRYNSSSDSLSSDVVQYLDRLRERGLVELLRDEELSP